jgi:hypothetical protein
MAIPVPLARKIKARSLNMLNYKPFGGIKAHTGLTKVRDERLICKRRLTQTEPPDASVMNIYFSLILRELFLSPLIKDLDRVSKTDAQPFLHPVEC